MPANPTLPPVRRMVLADHVYADILSALMDGQLASGETVSIDGMARQLDVSPTPVREALARLEATGMVQRVALKGYRVAPPLSAGELADLMDARLVLEPVNAERACARSTPGLYRELAAAAEALERAPYHGPFENLRKFWLADELFHRLIAEACGNQFLTSAYNALGGQTQIPRLRLRATDNIGDASDSVAEHFRILHAFEQNDPHQARRSMALHLEGVKARALRDLPQP